VNLGDIDAEPGLMRYFWHESDGDHSEEDRMHVCA